MNNYDGSTSPKRSARTVALTLFGTLLVTFAILLALAALAGLVTPKAYGAEASPPPVVCAYMSLDDIHRNMAKNNVGKDIKLELSSDPDVLKATREMIEAKLPETATNPLVAEEWTRITTVGFTMGKDALGTIIMIDKDNCVVDFVTGITDKPEAPKGTSL